MIVDDYWIDVVMSMSICWSFPYYSSPYQWHRHYPVISYWNWVDKHKKNQTVGQKSARRQIQPSKYSSTSTYSRLLEYSPLPWVYITTRNSNVPWNVPWNSAEHSLSPEIWDLHGNLIYLLNELEVQHSAFDTLNNRERLKYRSWYITYVPWLLSDQRYLTIKNAVK